ncbi:hypothetical protein J6590_099436 [Homalodisca vitripennis]|nr:hypothetical protein J6590_099436 [Homalodisca vitripennis]
MVSQRTNGSVVLGLLRVKEQMSVESVAYIDKNYPPKLGVQESFHRKLLSETRARTALGALGGNLVTSRGPGTAFDFALALAEKLTDKENAEKVKKAMLL